MTHRYSLAATLVVLLSVLPTTRVSGQTQLPIPRSLVDARSVYIVNNGVAGKAVENTVKAVKKWNRWSIVADAEVADITLTLSAQPTKMVYNWALNASMGVNAQFFSITTSNGVSLYGAEFYRLNPEKELQKLRKRLEEGNGQQK